QDEPDDPVLTACLREAWMAAAWPAALEPGDVVQVPLVFVAPDAQYVVAGTDARTREFGEGSRAQVLLDQAATGNAAVSLSTVELAAGQSTGLHRHPAAEIVYVLSGTGELAEAGGRARAL